LTDRVIEQDVVKWLMRVRSSESMTLLHNALAGGLTGLLSTLASCPIELVKCRTQGMLEIVSKPTSSGSAAAAANASIRYFWIPDEISLQHMPTMHRKQRTTKVQKLTFF